MLIETPGGFDYTGADCQGWMKEAGFRETPRRAPGRARTRWWSGSSSRRKSYQTQTRTWSLPSLTSTRSVKRSELKAPASAAVRMRPSGPGSASSARCSGTLTVTFSRSPVTRTLRVAALLGDHDLLVPLLDADELAVRRGGERLEHLAGEPHVLGRLVRQPQLVARAPPSVRSRVPPGRRRAAPGR